jgi:hypothetical protein
MEYNRAVERGIPRIIFVMDKEHPIRIDDVEQGEGGLKLAAFLERAKIDNIVKFFRSPADLRAEAINALAQLKETYLKTILPPPKTRQVMRIFVASPQDVFDERSRMPKIVESLNRTLGEIANVFVELWRWEANASPGVGEPQSLIDRDLDRADIVVVIFWNRFGMRTDGGTTGTESEVLRSLERWNKIKRPQVMMYFSQCPASLKTKETLEQKLQVVEFRKKVERLALTAEYESVADFEWRIRDDLQLTLFRMSKND